MTFYYDMYYKAEHNLCNNYKDIYIYAFDYGYTGNDIEKTEDKRYLIIKNSKDIDNVISGLKFPVKLKSEFLDSLYLYANFLENNKEELKSIIEFNNTTLKKIKKGSFKLKENINKVQNGKFNFKTEKDTIIDNFELTDEDKRYIQAMKDKIKNIIKKFEELKNSIKNVNVCKNINIDEYKKCFEEKYGKIAFNNIDEINKCLDENKKLEANFDLSFNKLKDMIDKFKNKINQLREINDILDENLKNKNLKDLDKYNDNYFDILLYKDLDKCNTNIKILQSRILDDFMCGKTDLQKKYLKIKKNKEKLCDEDKKNFQIWKEQEYDKKDFFINLNFNNFKSIEKEIIDLEKKMNDLIKAKEVNDNEVKLKAVAERRKKLEEERIKKEAEKKKNNKKLKQDSINTTSYVTKSTTTGTKYNINKPTTTIIDKSKIKTDAKKGSGFGMKPIINDEKTTTRTDNNTGCSCKKGGENSGGGCSSENDKT